MGTAGPRSLPLAKCVGTCFLLKICLKTEGLRSKSPSGGRPFRKSGNVGSLAGISILSSRAVRIVHPAASFCANLANSDFDSSRLAVTPVWSARTLTLPDYGRVVRNTTRLALSSVSCLHTQTPRLQVHVICKLTAPQVQRDCAAGHCFQRNRHSRVKRFAVSGNVVW